MVETDGKGKLKAEYTRADILTAQVRDGKVSYYLYDGHGDVRALLSEEGKITDQYRYNAYGELIEKTGDTENHYLYTGEYYDGTSNLYYLRARYMNPSTGNFLTMDTYEGSIYDPDTLHKYLYANGNPVTYSDPSGNFFSAVYAYTATAINTVMSNYQTLHIMGMISGITNSAITAFLGGSEEEISDAFIKGYITGFGLGAVMYVAAAYSALAYATILLGISSASVVMSVVLLIVSIVQHKEKETLVYGTLAILSLICWYQAYNLYGRIVITGDKGRATVEIEGDGGEDVVVGDSTQNSFQPPQVTTDANGNVTNGTYTISIKKMNPHINGTEGKSQFLYDVDANKAVLDAAAYADNYGLWEPGSGNSLDFFNKAKVYVTNGPVGVTGEGELTSYINIYRTKTGQVHGCPGNPPKQ